MSINLTLAFSRGRRPLENPSSSAALGFAAAGICLILSLVAHPARADTWPPPTPFDTLSENGWFVARVTPVSTNSKAIVIVSAIQGQQTNEIWRATLSNPECPTEVVVSDEGTGVVTLDNWQGIGYGDDVVAIYGPNGQKTKYSLEEFAPPPKPKTSSTDGFPLANFRGNYEGKFTHSVSSRHWRRYGIKFFYRDGGNLLFCLWLDWDNRWVVWQMMDGKLQKVTAELTSGLNTEGKRRSLQEVKSGTDSRAALNFLQRLQGQEDRP